MGGDERQADYGIITALRDELTALRTALVDVEEVQLGAVDIRYYYRGRLSCRDGTEAIVVCACSSEMGQKPALNVTRDLIAAWKPRHVLLVGIAGGIPGRGGTYGDVVVPLRVHDYEPGKLIPASIGPDGSERTRLPRWRTVPTSPRLGAAIEALAIEEEATWLRRVSEPRPDGSERRPLILRDEIASGEEVWASLDSATVQEVLTRSDKILAVENEASGFLSAVLEAPQPPDALVVKALSDLVAGKDDRWRTFAACASAAFAVALIEKLGARWRPGDRAAAKAAQERMEAAHQAITEEDYELAAGLAEEGAELARAGGDRALERRCRHQAVRAWGEHVAMSRLGRREFEKGVSRVRVHLDALESLDMPACHLALEKARLALFEDKGADALELSRQALRCA